MHNTSPSSVLNHLTSEASTLRLPEALWWKPCSLFIFWQRRARCLCAPATSQVCSEAATSQKADGMVIWFGYSNTHLLSYFYSTHWCWYKMLVCVFIFYFFCACARLPESNKTCMSRCGQSRHMPRRCSCMKKRCARRDSLILCVEHSHILCLDGRGELWRLKVSVHIFLIYVALGSCHMAETAYSWFYLG